MLINPRVNTYVNLKSIAYYCKVLTRSVHVCDINFMLFKLNLKFMIKIVLVVNLYNHFSLRSA